MGHAGLLFKGELLRVHPERKGKEGKGKGEGVREGGRSHLAVPVAPGRGLPLALAVDKERDGRKRRARSPPFRPNHGAIVHFSTLWPAQARKKSAARPLRRVRISTASALWASAVRSKTARSRGRRLFSTLEHGLALHSEHAHLLSDIERLPLPISGSLFPFWSPTGDLVRHWQCQLEATSTLA